MLLQREMGQILLSLKLSQRNCFILNCGILDFLSRWLNNVWSFTRFNMSKSFSLHMCALLIYLSLGESWRDKEKGLKMEPIFILWKLCIDACVKQMKSRKDLKARWMKAIWPKYPIHGAGAKWNAFALSAFYGNRRRERIRHLVHFWGRYTNTFRAQFLCTIFEREMCQNWLCTIPFLCTIF